MDYESLTVQIEPHIEASFDSLPEVLRVRIEDAYSLFGWDNLNSWQRKTVAQQHDDHYDPANQQINDYFEGLSCQLQNAKRELKDWEVMNPQTVSEREILVSKLKEIRGRIDSIKSQLRGPYEPVDGTLTGATTAPVADAMKPANDGPVPKKKSVKRLIFEAKVIELMDKFWNERTTGTEPTKGDLERLVYPEILRTNVRGVRKTTASMVRDAAKPWKQPLVLPAFVPDSKFNDKRHPFKGDK